MNEGKSLIIAYDIIGPLMAGPGLRSLRIAEALSRSMKVDLLIGAESEPVPGSDVNFINPPSAGSETGFFEEYNACLASSTFPLTHPWLMMSDIPLAIDCYDPYVLENLHLYASKAPQEAAYYHERHLTAQLQAILRADLVLCASGRQRDLFTGALMAMNRLNPGFDGKFGAENIIEIVPFGIEENDPPESGGLRGKLDGYGDDDEVLLWGGGIWEWFEPLNLIRAVDELKGHRKTIRLHFLGVKHPNKHIPFPAKAREAIELSEILGLKNKHVFFGDWVPADERWKFLRDADLGVSFHQPGLETRYGFRTRLMDYLWADLPMVVSAGDDLGEELASAGLGETVQDNEVDTIAAAIERQLDKVNSNPTSADNFKTLKDAYRWSNVIKPLEEFFISPRTAAGIRGTGFFEKTLGGINPADAPKGVKQIIRRIIKSGD